MDVKYFRPRSFSAGSAGMDIASGDFCSHPCKHHPITSKYPNGIATKHIPELEDFIKELSEGLSRLSFPRQEKPYVTGHVLFLHWQHDDLNTKAEIQELESVFKQLYCFTTERYPIPSEDPFNQLEEKLVLTRNQFSRSQNSLLIIYYGGHGELDKQNRSIWKAWKFPPRGAGGWTPWLDWTELQLRMQTAKGDILFILDCCYASSMVRGSQQGTKELLAASGKGDKASGSKQNSFTRAVIKELNELQGRPCHVTLLHQLLLRNQAQHNLTPTPIYTCLSEGGPNIVLSPLPTHGTPSSLSPDVRVSASHSSYTMITSRETSRCSSLGSFSSVLSTTDCRVLISVSLENPKKRPIAAEWINWFRAHAPQDIGGVNVELQSFVKLEAAWESNSVYLLVSLPVALWNALPHNPALSFQAVIRSTNLLKQGLEKAVQTERMDSGAEGPISEDSAAGGHAHQTQLSWAGLEDFANLLSDNLKSELANKYNPLSSAVGEGYRETVKLLLQNANPDSSDRNERTPLSCAAEKGQLEIVKLLLVNNADPDSRDGDRRTPLSWAAEEGQSEIVELLLRKNAKPNSIDRNGRTPLSWAAEKGQSEIVKLLLVNNANPDSSDRNERTPLSWAAEKGQLEIVKLLLVNNANPDSRDGDGRTPLSWAAEEGQSEIVKLLLRKNAKPDSSDRNGRTPLSWAAEEGQSEIVELLLEKNAKPDSSDINERTPLSWAAEKGQLEIVKLLLVNNADSNSTDSQGRTPLSWAADKGESEIVKLLLKKNAKPDLSDRNGRTPLSWAAEKGHPEIVKLLLVNNADSNSTDSQGRTPLSWAAERGHESVVNVLIEARSVRLDLPDFGFKRTPLLWASKSGNETIIRVLLEAGADLEPKDHFGQTPLSIAAEYGHETIVELLLNEKADPELRDRNGRTTLWWAAKSGNERTVRVLLETGVDVGSKDHFGQTPLSIAAEYGHEMIVELLSSEKADSEL